MQLQRISPSVLVLASVIACANPTAAGLSSLSGTWRTAPENAQPQGWYLRSLTFGADGAFTSEFRSYGVYAGQPREELSGYQRTEGTYRVAGQRLIFEPQRLVSWDRFYGANSPETMSEPYPYGSIFDDARYVLLGSQLSLRYTTYPADAPVGTLLVFTRTD